MEDLKREKGENFAVIAYHISDSFSTPYDWGNNRYQYYRPGSVAVPLSILGGTSQFLGGIPNGNMYDNFLPAYNTIVSVAPASDISITLEAPGRVRVSATNISGSTIQGTLHIALIERHRPYSWRDLNEVDSICRQMLPGPNGQAINLAPSQSYVSVQEFTTESDWSYCSLVAFVQTGDKRILQGAILDLEDTIPKIQIQNGPETGTLWLKGSTHSFSYTTSRPLPSVSFQYSSDGGSNWNDFTPTPLSGNLYSWTLPSLSSNQCLMRVRDPFGGAQDTSGLFGIGAIGDLNADSVINASDRAILVDYLLENKTALIPGADLDGNGMVDLFDLIYFDTELTF